MELQIELDLDLDVAGRRRDTHALDQRLQIVEVARLYSRLSQVDHGGLEQRAEAVDLAHVLRRERALLETAMVHLAQARSEEHTSELQSPDHLVCPLLL